MQQAVRGALIGFMTALSQAQAEATKEAQRAGIEHAKAMTGKYRGRKPSYTRNQLSDVLERFGRGEGTSAVATAVGLSRQTILRIKADPVEAHKITTLWEL
jgi:putative DNA-invertase from lambdoid prophage Rac